MTDLNNIVSLSITTTGNGDVYSSFLKMHQYLIFFKCHSLIVEVVAVVLLLKVLFVVDILKKVYSEHVLEYFRIIMIQIRLSKT